ncbi:hypothetical protein KCU81_g6012, partial [Aureobasidium melanogenum]|uniref:Azaphilone pigments biosynthesis cluster protein L N-terminal domain-containing protein n=1 Tax=Aureobasidium melanogenum (strain CBS 110374) TaxID=1043003 RepID=A0A074VZ04_AURM1
MTDPLSIVAGVVGIVATTTHAIHTAVDLIDKIEAAPKAVYQIRAELNDTESVVLQLEKILDGSANDTTWTQLLDGSKLSSALKTLRTVCESFVSTLQKWTRHSPSSDKLSLRDGFLIATQSRKISQLSTQLNNCKQSVTMAMSSCALQGQVQHARTTERIVELLTQEKEATRLLAAQRAVIEGLRPEEERLQIVKRQSEDTGDIDEIERVEEGLRDISRARMVVGQFATVSEYVVKSSRAVRTNQDIGNVTIAELGYGAVGISNIDEVLDVKQNIGDVSVGKKSTGFVGIHNNIDHNAAFANRWGPVSGP